MLHAVVTRSLLTKSLPTLFLLACAAAASAQDPAQRLGPMPAPGTTRAKVVEVQASEPVPAGQVPRALAKPPVENALDARQQLALAQLEAAERQLERLSTFNQQAQPSADRFLSSSVLPYTQVRPELIPDPVGVVSPSSPFSHVLATAEQRRQRALLELEADSPAGVAQLRTLEEVEADLRRNAFLQASAAERMERMEAVSYLTYSSIWHNLGERLQLQLLEAQLREQELLEEREALLAASQSAGDGVE